MKKFGIAILIILLIIFVQCGLQGMFGFLKGMFDSLGNLLN